MKDTDTQNLEAALEVARRQAEAEKSLADALKALEAAGEQAARRRRSKLDPAPTPRFDPSPPSGEANAESPAKPREK